MQLQNQQHSKPHKFRLSVIETEKENEFAKEMKGNIWDFIGKVNVICFTTNNFVTNGKNVLGAGLAKEALIRYPDLDVKIGQAIKEFGGYPYIVKCYRQTMIMTFPVKPDFAIVNDTKSNVVSHKKHLYQTGQKIPGFHSIADINLIRNSARCLNTVVSTMRDRWKHVLIPRVGTGVGELEWKIVKQILKEENLYDQPNVHFISKE